MKQLTLFISLSFLFSACHYPNSSFYSKTGSKSTVLSGRVLPQWSKFIGHESGRDSIKLNIAAKSQGLWVVRRAGTLFSLDAHSGHIHWQTHTRYPITTPPSISRQWLAVVTEEPRLLVLHAHTGKTAWSTALSNSVLARPTIDSEQIIIKTQAGEVIAFNLKSGKKLWHYRQPIALSSLVLHYSSAVQIQDDQVLAGFPDGMLTALDLQSGLLRWQKNLAKPKAVSNTLQLTDIAADPLISKNTLFVTTHQGTLSALSTDSGHILWQRSFASHTGVALGRYLYATDIAGVIWAFHPDNGKIAWKQDSLRDHRLTAPICSTEDILLIADEQGILHALSQKDGHLLFSTPSKIRSPILQAPVVQDNKVYTVTNRGQITAWKLSDMLSFY